MRTNVITGVQASPILEKHLMEGTNMKTEYTSTTGRGSVMHNVGQLRYCMQQSSKAQSPG